MANVILSAHNPHPSSGEVPIGSRVTFKEAVFGYTGKPRYWWKGQQQGQWRVPEEEKATFNEVCRELEQMDITFWYEVEQHKEGTKPGCRSLRKIQCHVSLM